MIEKVKIQLSKYSLENIIFTKHAIIQALARNINIEEVKQNIINPKGLIYVEKQEADLELEEKYDCYFEQGKTNIKDIS
ncbi:hypothetical protein J4477_00565 [Candidatus Pacearchaeota archaeon]|nr:hypothetical protein [Candidatus Pacearchaeota archaeon]